MLPSMRFYIISIVSIFAALGIGILIGFTMDTQNFLNDQKYNITKVLESQLEVMVSENKDLKSKRKILEFENNYKDEYIDKSYEHIIKGKLIGLNIGVIMTNNDYPFPEIEESLELAGAKIINLTILSEEILNQNIIDELYMQLELDKDKDLTEYMILTITESIIKGVPNPIFHILLNAGLINYKNNYNESIDYLIICGGGLIDQNKRINLIDKLVVETANKYEIPILGVERSDAKYSYINSYQNFGISTVDNIDMTIGKVAMILIMEGNKGSFGIKNTSTSIIPNINMDFLK